MLKPYSQQNQQTGSVLFMALLFLVLTALIAVTIMDTSILSRKMAGNNQFKEEAMQVAEGIVNEIALSVIAALEGVKAPVVGDTMCMVGSTDPVCTSTQKILKLSPEMEKARQGAVVDYKAQFNREASQSAGGGARMGEGQISAGLLLRFVEVEGLYDGATNGRGLSQASLAIGIMNKALSANGGGVANVKSDGAGFTGSGGWGSQ